MSTSAEARAAPAQNDTLRGLGFLFVTAFGWGFSWPVQKYLLSEMPPFSMRAAAGVIAMTVGFGLAVARRESLRVPPGQWRILTVAAMLNYGLFSLLTIISLMWLHASEAVIFTYTMPIWTVILARVFYGERLTAARGIALVLGLCGIAVLVGAQAPAASLAKLPGILSGLAAAWVFATGTVISKNRPPRLPPVAGVAWQIAIGTIPALLLCTSETGGWHGISGLGWTALLFCGAVPMVLCYLTWFRALHFLPAGTASVGTLIAPVVGVSGSAVLLGEPLGYRQLIALGVTLAGVALAARR